MLFKTLKISVRSYAVTIWRPLLAAAAMGFTVQALVRRRTRSRHSHPWRLPVFIPAGVAIYMVSLAALWLAAGKPSGAETLFLARLRDAIARFERLFGSRPSGQLHQKKAGSWTSGEDGEARSLYSLLRGGLRAVFLTSANVTAAGRSTR